MRPLSLDSRLASQADPWYKRNTCAVAFESWKALGFGLPGGKPGEGKTSPNEKIVREPLR